MAESRTAVMAALLGNAALAVMKGVAAVSTGSAAMVAETFHSAADTGNQVLLFLGLRLSERPPDRAHGFGHGRDVSFSSRARSSWRGAPSPRRGAARACAGSGVTTAIRRCPPSCSRTPPPSCLSALHPRDLAQSGHGNGPVGRR